MQLTAYIWLTSYLLHESCNCCTVCLIPVFPIILRKGTYFSPLFDCCINICWLFHSFQTIIISILSYVLPDCLYCMYTKCTINTALHALCYRDSVFKAYIPFSTHADWIHCLYFLSLLNGRHMFPPCKCCKVIWFLLICQFKHTSYNHWQRIFSPDVMTTLSKFNILQCLSWSKLDGRNPPEKYI